MARTVSYDTVTAGESSDAAGLYADKDGSWGRWSDTSTGPVLEETFLSSNVGLRYDHPLHSFENWSTKENAKLLFTGHVIAADFHCAPTDTSTIFGPDGRPFDLSTTQPLFCVVKRGRAL